MKILTLIFLPLLNAILAGLGGRWLGRKGACALTVTGMVITLLTAYYHFVFTLVTPTVYHLKLGTWISSELLKVTWSFIIGPLATTMFFCSGTLFLFFLRAYLISFATVFVCIFLANVFLVSPVPESATQLSLSWLLFMINPNANQQGAAVPITAQVVPAGQVMNQPLFFDDPVLPAPGFFQQIPFLGGLPNFFPVQIFTPPIFGGLGALVGGGFLVPLATQLAHGVNPPVVPGGGFHVPPVLPANFWPNQALPVPGPLPDQHLIQSMANAASAQLPYVFLGGVVLVFAGAAWKYSQKKEILLESAPNFTNFSQPISTFTSGKPLKYSLQTDEGWKNLQQIHAWRADKTDVVSCMQVNLDSGFSIKLFGIPINFSVVPFICVTGGLNEILISFFLNQVRRYSCRLIRRQLITLWRSFLFYEVQKVTKIAAALFFTVRSSNGPSGFFDTEKLFFTWEAMKNFVFSFLDFNHAENKK